MARNMIEVSTVRDANVVSGGGVSPITSASHANAGATADAARYLFSFETERSVNAAELAVLSQKEANRGTVTEAELALNAFKGVLLDLCEQYGAVTISTPFGTFETRCEGSADNAFTLPAEGSVHLDFVFSDAQRREFAKIDARVPVAGETARIVRVTTHYEGGGKSREKVLAVGQPFHLEGVGITYGGEGETLALWDAALAAKVCDVAVNTHAVGSLWFCAMPDIAITPGRYKLVLNTFAGGDKLEQLTHDVDVEGEPTPPGPIAETSDGQVKIMSVSDGGQSETFTFGDEWTAGGEGFTGSEAQWFAELASVRTMPEADAVMASCQALDANTLKIECDAGDAPAAGDYPDATLEIGMAHYDSGELVTETLIVPIHLVVNE